MAGKTRKNLKPTWSGEGTFPASVSTPMPRFRTTMVGDFFRVAPIHATERLEAASSRVFDWLLKRLGQVAKRNPDHDMAVRDEEVVAILLGDYVGKCRSPRDAFGTFL